MKRTISALAALGAALSLVAVTPAAEARGFHSRGHYGHGHYAGGYGHRGHGYWRGGRWIGLGLAVPLIAGAAIAADRDCYWEYGHRYCDY